MERAGRSAVAIELAGEERETLVRWSRRHSLSQALALRSRIVLACADGCGRRKSASRHATRDPRCRPRLCAAAPQCNRCCARLLKPGNRRPALRVLLTFT
jgi:hypothetical protein